MREIVLLSVIDIEVNTSSGNVVSIFGCSNICTCGTMMDLFVVVTAVRAVVIYALHIMQ